MGGAGLAVLAGRKFRGPTLSMLTRVIASSLLLAPMLVGQVTAQEAPLSAEEVRALRQRIEELEQKVKALEQAQAAGGATNQDRRVEQLDQQVKALERSRAQ